MISFEVATIHWCGTFAFHCFYVDVNGNVLKSPFSKYPFIQCKLVTSIKMAVNNRDWWFYPFVFCFSKLEKDVTYLFNCLWVQYYSVTYDEIVFCFAVLLNRKILSNKSFKEQNFLHVLKYFKVRQYQSFNFVNQFARIF